MNLFLAGGEDKRQLICIAIAHELARTKARMTALATYFVMQPRERREIAAMWALSRELGYVDMIVDSGLFTMMFGAGKGKVYTLSDLRAYTKAYLSYLSEREFPGVCVEMDVHKVLGLPALKELRALCAGMWPCERMIYVWHIEEGIDGLRALVDRYPYIALSIPELRIIASKAGTSVPAMLSNLLATIRAEPKGDTVRVHLLGCSQLSLMANPDYDTCDSTSWMAGYRWGRNQKHIKGKMQGLRVQRDYMLSSTNIHARELNDEAIRCTDEFLVRHGLKDLREDLRTNRGKNGYMTAGVFTAREYLLAEQAINETYYMPGARKRRPYNPWRRDDGQ